MEAAPQPYGWKGRRYLADAGLYANRARFYSPAMGRFLSEDPLGFGGGDTNLYDFAWNSPRNWSDPTGLAAGEPAPVGGSDSAEEAALSKIETEAAPAQQVVGEKIADDLYLVASEVDKAAEGGLTPAEQLTAAAERAVQAVEPGSGPVYGTAVHSAFEAEVEALGDANLATEQSYLNGKPVSRGTLGSVRLDVVEGPIDAPTCCYDLKTGSATLTPGRIGQIQANIPGGANVPVIQITPP